jgi:hypothetical protein
MTPDQFLDRCKVICHVGPPGVWDRIVLRGFQTAEQLILDAELDEAQRQLLLTTPRKDPTSLRINQEVIPLRDQGPLFARSDLTTILGDGMTVSDWIHRLNRRIYFFTDEANMAKLRDKYVEIDGAQDVIWLSPLKFLNATRLKLELSDQNSGAVARTTGPQKRIDTFKSLSRFPDKKPAEVTVVDGFDDLTPVFRVERYFKDKPRETLAK